LIAKKQLIPHLKRRKNNNKKKQSGKKSEKGEYAGSGPPS